MAALVAAVYSVLPILGSIQNRPDKLNGVLLPFHLIGPRWCWPRRRIFRHLAAPDGGAPATGWWDCFVAFMGIWILTMFTYDYARFGKGKDSGYQSSINFGAPFHLVAFLLNWPVGIVLAASLPTKGGVAEVSVVLTLIQLRVLAGLAFG